MSRRHRRQGGGQAAAAGGRQQIERLLEKGRIKDAFKQAKLCFREDASDDHRRLLERTYLLRVKDLWQGGMPAAAAEVAKSFLEFGISEPATLGEFAALLPQLGMAEQAQRLGARLQAPEAQAALSVSLADRAVLHPEQIPSSLTEIGVGAARIRLALGALDERHEDRATELLKDIPRSSPWADWRYFVRGLAAFRRGDREQACANWGRLDSQRSAYRIAATLTTLPAGPGAPDTAVQRRDLSKIDLSRLETAVFGEPVLARLERLRRLVDKTNPKRDWKQAMVVFATLNATLRRLDRRLSQRLTEILLPLVMDEATDRSLDAGRRFVNDFTRVAEPLPLDPHWNRAWAWCWELADDADEAVTYWRKYIGDIEGLDNVDPGQQRQIRALVWWHIGRSLADEAREVCPPWAGEAPSEKERERDLRRRVVEALEESLRLDPARRSTHDTLISLYQEWSEPEKGLEASLRLLQFFPDDLQALRSLGDYHFRRNEPEEALAYARRARAVKPLDRALIDLEYWSLLGVARLRALAGRWDEGRAAFAGAEALRPEAAGDYLVLARRALFELKAGDRERSAELIEEAKRSLSEPAPLWLVLAIEARRYELPGARAAEFNRELRLLLRKKKSGETAGRLAGLVLAYQQSGFDYPDKGEHLAAVLGYVCATSRTKYAERDLVQVCHLLSETEESPDLLERFIRRGRKSFPRCPVFPFLAADQEIERGPASCNLRYVRRNLEQALTLAEADGEGRYAALAADLKQRLAQLGRVNTMAAMLNEHLGGTSEFGNDVAGLLNMLGGLGQDDDDDGDEEGDDEFEAFADFFRSRFVEPGKPPDRRDPNRRRAK